jgi:hypothetical protein
MILYLKEAEDSTKNLLDLMCTFGNRAGWYIINIQNSVAYTNEQDEKEIRKTIPFTIASKNK